jgi:hypothetical protein
MDARVRDIVPSITSPPKSTWHKPIISRSLYSAQCLPIRERRRGSVYSYEGKTLTPQLGKYSTPLLLTRKLHTCENLDSDQSTSKARQLR